jgi:hypothetical protein
VQARVGRRREAGTGSRPQVLQHPPDPQETYQNQAPRDTYLDVLEPALLSSSNRLFQSVWTSLPSAIVASGEIIVFLSFLCSRTKLPAIKTKFVVIRTVSGQVITLTPGHFICLSNALVDSAAAKVRDNIFLGNGALSTVSSVSQTVEAGLYNPQTLQGDIVVNGIIASTYTTALPPDTAHALLLPLRALYSAFSLLVNGFENCAIQHVVKKYSS